MFLLRYEGARQTVKIDNIGEVKLIPDCLIKLVDRSLVDAFMKAIRGVDRKGKPKEVKGRFTCVTRPSLPGETPNYKLPENTKNTDEMQEDSDGSDLEDEDEN